MIKLLLTLLLLPSIALAGTKIDKSNLVYLGAFRVPQGELGGIKSLSGDPYVGAQYQPMTYNPNGNSIIINAYPSSRMTAEISIPSLIKDTPIGSLNTSTVIQNPVSIPGNSWDLLHSDGTAATGEAAAISGGWLVYGGKLLGTAWSYYDASGGNGARSHFSANLSNWAAGTGFAGMYTVGVSPDVAATASGGYVGEAMAKVPDEWQTALGYPVLTGRSGGPIVSRSSYGPTAWGFDPAKLGVQSPVPATMFVGYPNSHQTLGAFTDSPNMLYNRSTANVAMIFPKGSDTVLFLGQGALGIELDGSGVPITTSYSCTGAGTSNRSEEKSNSWLVANSPNGWTCGSTSMSAASIAGGDSCCLDPANTASTGLHTYSYKVGTGQTCYGMGTTDLSRVRSNAWLRANSPSGWVCGPASVSAGEISAGDGCCYAGPGGTTDKGTFGFPYVYQAWKYDANDFVKVKNGMVNPSTGQPYKPWDLTPETWVFDLPYAPSFKRIIGAGYDETTQKVYVGQAFGDGNYPVVHAFSISGLAQSATSTILSGAISGTIH